LNQGYFVDLGEGRAKLRWRRHSSDQIRFEAVKPERGLDFDVATFFCDVPSFAALCDGGILNMTSEHGSFMARVTGDSIWIVFQVDAWSYQDSCLVPRHAFGEIVPAPEAMN
jgi:hypothetical protein